MILITHQPLRGTLLCAMRHKVDSAAYSVENLTDERASRYPPYVAVFNKARRDSVRRGIPFEISFEFYLSLIGLPCHYCHAPLKWSQRKYISRSGIWALGGSNLDRKDNSQGYTDDNVTACCWPCNRIKNKFVSYEEMLVIGAARKRFREGQFFPVAATSLATLSEIHRASSTSSATITVRLVEQVTGEDLYLFASDRNIALSNERRLFRRLTGSLYSTPSRGN